MLQQALYIGCDRREHVSRPGIIIGVHRVGHCLGGAGGTSWSGRGRIYGRRPARALSKVRGLLQALAQPHRRVGGSHRWARFPAPLGRANKLLARQCAMADALRSSLLLAAYGSPGGCPTKPPAASPAATPPMAPCLPPPPPLLAGCLCRGVAQCCCSCWRPLSLALQQGGS